MYIPKPRPKDVGLRLHAHSGVALRVSQRSAVGRTSERLATYSSVVVHPISRPGVVARPPFV